MAHAPTSKTLYDPKHENHKAEPVRHEVIKTDDDGLLDPNEEGLTIGEIQRRTSAKNEHERIAKATAEMAKKK